MDRPADPDSHPDKACSAKLLHKGTKAVVPAVPTPLLDLDAAEGDVEVVMNHDGVGKRKLVKTERLGHRAPGEIHVGLGLEQEKPLAVPGRLAEDAGETLPGNRCADGVGKAV